MSLIDFASEFEETAPSSVLSTATPKPKIDFLREIITKLLQHIGDNIKIQGSELTNARLT